MPRYLQITPHVSLNLGPPKGDRRLRSLIATRAAVPKAPVHKQGNFGFVKNEVRLAENRRVSPPARHLVCSEESCHLQFSACVPASPNAGHNQRPLRLGENISHRPWGLYVYFAGPNFLSSQLNTARCSSMPARRTWESSQMAVGFSPVMFLAP